LGNIKGRPFSGAAFLLVNGAAVSVVFYELIHHGFAEKFSEFDPDPAFFERFFDPHDFT
jgi:hypothetical protein